MASDWETEEEYRERVSEGRRRVERVRYQLLRDELSRAHRAIPSEDYDDSTEKRVENLDKTLSALRDFLRSAPR